MPQEHNEKMSKTLPEGLVKPKDPVTIYATAKDPFHKDGAAYVVHSALAKKLIAAGKATDKEPAKKDAAK